jgi:hypothetical protein
MTHNQYLNHQAIAPHNQQHQNCDRTPAQLQRDR